MKVSVNWIREFTDIKCSVDELVTKIGAQLGAVEEVISLGERYKDVLVAKVVSCEKHPNADRLNVCKVDDGGKAKGVVRDENGFVQVVCGAPNVRKNIFVAWLPPGSVVPSTYDGERFELGARELRGVVSNGMLASGKELAINNDHEGILILDKKAAPGDSFSEPYKLDDYIIDIENKMFTHRPDLFGILGVAREIAGIQHVDFTSPEWYLKDLDAFKVDGEPLKLEVRNEVPALARRFMAVPMTGITVTKSPIMIQSFLTRVGIKPINNIVDITNFVMVLTGQPLHAFDYDKVAAQDNAQSATIVVRSPHKGEKIALLNGKTIEPRADAIMIASEKRLLGVAGVMGGTDTEVDFSTKNIILECANFDMYSIRRTSMAHGLFTDAVTRFNKGQSPLQNDNILAYSIAWVKKLANGKVAHPVIDLNHLTGWAKTTEYSLHPPVMITPDFINKRLGTKLSKAEITKLLENVEFLIDDVKDEIRVSAPFWRTDIEIPEDVVEEVGRLYGYDHLPLELPKRDLTPAPANPMIELKSKIRTILSSAGANEMLSYSFVHGDLIDKVGQNKDDAFELNNAISPELQYYRLSLTPSLLDKVHANIRADYVRSDDNEFALFEINKAHNKHLKDKEDLPLELQSLALVFAADDKTAKRKYNGAPYYMARTYLTQLFKGLGSELPVLKPLSSVEKQIETTKPFEPKRSAVIEHEGKIIGVVGEYKTSVKKALKLPDYTAGFEIGVTHLLQQLAEKDYKSISRYPKTQQDMSFKVANKVSYADLFTNIQSSLHDAEIEHGYDTTLTAIDIYQDDKDMAHKTITLRVWLSHPERTLTTVEVNKLLDHVSEKVRTKLDAHRV